MSGSNDHNYLYRVLGLSFLPRALTFLLTLFSFPLMVRGLGATEYGVMVYLTSVSAMLEIPAGFGVSGAVGKAIAECRTYMPQRLAEQLRRWMKWQLVVCLCSLPVSAAIGYLSTVWVGQKVPLGLLVIVLVSLYVSVLVSFSRSVLTSMLRFKQLAMLDAFESLTRSAGWLLVGFLFQSMWALAWVQLASAAMVFMLAMFFLLVWRTPPASESAVAPDDMAVLTNVGMFRQSLAFLMLLMGTRAYQALPILLTSRLLGFEATGILGAFTKIAELANVPFNIIGNALMVRVPEIHRRGAEVVTRYWDMLSKLAVLGLGAGAGFWLMSHTIASWMLPASGQSQQFFAILSVMIFARAISDLAAPAADYVGGLKRRIYFLLSFAVLQLPLIWLASQFGGAPAVFAVIAASYSLMVVGYIGIAKKVFFGQRRYRPPRVAATGSTLVVGVALASALLFNIWYWQVAFFIGLCIVLFLSSAELRRAFWPTRLIRFDFL